MISDLIYLICDRYFRKQEAESKLTTDMIILTEHLIRMLKWEDYDGNRKYIKTVVRRGGRRVFNHTVSSLFKFKKTQLHRIICEEPLEKLFWHHLRFLERECDINFEGTFKSYRTDEEVYEILKKILTIYAHEVFQAQYENSVADLEDIINDLNIYIYGLNN